MDIFGGDLRNFIILKDIERSENNKEICKGRKSN